MAWAEREGEPKASQGEERKLGLGRVVEGVKASADRGEESGFGLEVGFENVEVGKQTSLEFRMLGEEGCVAQARATDGE